MAVASRQIAASGAPEFRAHGNWRGKLQQQQHNATSKIHDGRDMMKSSKENIGDDRIHQNKYNSCRLVICDTTRSPARPLTLRLLCRLFLNLHQWSLCIVNALGHIHPHIQEQGHENEEQVGQHGIAQVVRAVLYDALHEWVDPTRDQVQCDLEAKEQRLAAGGYEAGKKHAIVRTQGTAGAHEKELSNPELGNMLVANGHAGADAEAAPEHAQHLDSKEAIRPNFDRIAEASICPSSGQKMGEGQHPRQ